MKNFTNALNALALFSWMGTVPLVLGGCAAAEEATVEPVAAQEQLLPLNLENPDDNARAFLLTRGSLNPDDEIMFYWKGEILLVEQPDPNGNPQRDYRSPILYFDGFNIARFVETIDGTRMMSREITVYRTASGRILDCWKSPWSNNGVRVAHVANDPVNFTLGATDYDILGDRVIFKANISLDYPSPLPMNAYPQYSTGNTYQSTELFNFYASVFDLRDPNATTVPVEISWSRVGQPLPWMQIDPGRKVQLVYHSRGRKLLEGWDGLPQDLKDFVEEYHPGFKHAPTTDESPNETSWRRFKKLLDDGKYTPTCF